jgi:regulator of CtrA degradation
MRHDEVENVHNLTQLSFSGSALFRRTFDEGMALVEETARYLDGPGRAEARALSRKGAILYAGESMRLTTRMMQAASWLLVQRAVHDGDMDANQAASSRYRLGSREICLGAPSEGDDLLPEALRDLLARSDNLYRRILRLDEILFSGGSEPLPRTSGVHLQLNRLEQAFSRD